METKIKVTTNIPRKSLHVITEYCQDDPRLIVPLHERVSTAISAAMSHHGDWSIPEFNDQTVFNRICIGEQDITICVQKITRKDSDIILILCRQPESCEAFDAVDNFPPEELKHHLLVGNFGEYELTVKEIFKCFQQTDINSISHGTGQVTEICHLAGLHWALRATKRRASYWIGVLGEKIHFNNSHNLRLWHSEKNEPWGLGLYFQGTYEYCMLIDRGLLVIVSPNDGDELDIEKLATDQIALSFVLGQRISINRLVGFDIEGRLCAERKGLPYTAPTEHGWRFTPVPTIELDGDSAIDNTTWLAAFFKRCSKVLREHPEYRLDSALVTYVDSLSGDIIPAYLRIQVQIEALAYHLLNALDKSKTKSTLVRSKSAWRKFISTTIKDKLKEHALDDKAEQTLLTRMQRACEHGSGERVRDVFNYFKLDLCHCAINELDERDVIVHQMEISKERNGTIMVGREIARIRAVQTLLVALIALAAGYRGKIRQWAHPLVMPLNDLAASGDRAFRVWWMLDEADIGEARKFYVAHVSPRPRSDTT